MEEKVFDRIEKKYLITKQDKRQLIKLIKRNMQKDSYHESIGLISRKKFALEVMRDMIAYSLK